MVLVGTYSVVALRLLLCQDASAVRRKGKPSLIIARIVTCPQLVGESAVKKCIV